MRWQNPVILTIIVATTSLMVAVVTRGVLRLLGR